MKKITYYLIAFFFAAFSWQGMAQVLNQNATWPNANWTVTGNYNTDPTAFESDPTITSNFAFDDDDAGDSHEDNIAAESPIIDLTAAHTAGETLLSISGDYVYNYVADDELKFQYWDADSSIWTDWGFGFTQDTASAPTDDFCSGTSETYTSSDLDISSFTTTQLAGFKYRISYDDDPAGTDWNYGFCFQPPTIVSATPPACPDVTNITASNFTAPEMADLSWDAVTGATGYNWEIQLQGTAQGDPAGIIYGAGTQNTVTATNLTSGTDYTLYVQTDCSGNGTANYVSYDFTYILPPANDDCADATSLTVNADLACGAVESGTLLGATDSGVSDNGAGTPNNDVWFSFVAAADTHEIKILNKVANNGSTDLVHEVLSGDCATLVSENITDYPDYSTVSGLIIGDTYYVRVFSYGTSATDVAFDMCVGTFPPPPANDDACNAEMLTINDAPTVATNVSATGQTDEPSPSCWSDSTVNSVWFSFVADEYDITVSTDFDTPLNDTSIAIYSATDCTDFTSYTQVGCDTDGGDAGTFGWNSVADLTGLNEGETYYIQVEGYNTKMDEFNIQVTHTPPANDNLCDAIAVNVGDTSAGDAFTNFAATAETDEPKGDCFSDGITGSVWFTFVAPASGAVNVTTDIAGGTNTDTEVAVYAAPTDCTDMTTLAPALGCNQDVDVFGGNYLSTVFVHGLTPGDTYYIQVDNWDGTFEGGTFGLEVQEVTVFNPVFESNIVSDCANSSDFSVDINVTDLGGASTVTVTDGTTTVPNVSTGVQTFGPYAAGTSIDFVVTSDDDATFTTTQTVTYTCPPANDLAADAIAVACGDTVTGDTSAGATIDVQGDCGSVDNDAPNMWYSFTGTGTAENITASLCGSSYDTSIAIYTGTPGNLSCYANNDDSCGLQSEVTFVSDGTQTYYIMVEGYDAGDTGAFSLAITCEPACTPAVTNQDCGSALAIIMDDPAITSDNTCATVNIDNPSCDLFGTIADVWFSFEAPASGITTITTTLGTATEINLAVYEGACGSLTEVTGTCSATADAPDTINLNTLTPGATYYVQAWNAGSTSATPQEGTFDIQITNLNISVPDCVTMTYPADGATEVPYPLTLTWDVATTGDPADSYNVYVSVNGGTEGLFGNFPTTQSDPITMLNPDLSIVWRVVPVNAAGENTACASTFSFTTFVGTDDTDGDGISNIDERDATPQSSMTAPCDPAQAAGYTGYDATNTIWGAADCDGDGQNNAQEDAGGSDPYDAGSTVSVEELEAVGFEYYPNPVNSNLTVKANENITSIAIFNMLGQQVKQVNPSSLNAQIDMTSLANGTYFIKATVGEKVGTFKIIKK